ncbi:MAG TPA: DNA polymerase III subunit alpha [Candidatus Kapabacteria bacterium]|nr:DNA polymerase III subunit alpha [Candidatus Kapabacteria bacterium]
MPEFIHLHNHTHYSLLDGACKVETLVKAAGENDMSAVALTDHGVTFGAMEFYKKAQKAGVKPIIGCEVYVADGPRFDRQLNQVGNSKKRRNYFHLVLLAKDYQGYRSLNRLTSRAHTEGYYYKPRIDRELLEECHEGLIALSACAGGVVSAHLVNEDLGAAREAAIWYRELFGQDFFLEVQDHGIPVDRYVLEGMPILSKELGIPLVATNDCHYIRKEHAVAHNVLLHIRDASKNGARIDVENELRYGTKNYYFKTADEMAELLGHFPGAIENTIAIAERCNVEMPKELYMPQFPIPAESSATTLDDYLREITWRGIDKRYPDVTEDVRERTEFELDVITRMGYSGYFLIVQDFIQAARDRGVSVGPGRGSAAGSIAAYAMGITNIDPIKYDLLFERFLNPDRVSMPDIDVDFADDKREAVIDYVKEKYGHDAVAQIITFGTLSSRAVLKDVGRVLGIPLSTINSITEKITVKFGRVQSLKEAIEQNPELRWVKDSDDAQLHKLIEYSQVLEGFCRNASLHAAGVVIAPGPLEEYIPLYKTPDSGLASQYTMNDLEDAGLLKMDFLGLRTLTIIVNTLELIRQRHEIEIDIDAIPMEDAKTYELVGKGATTAVFQFESPPMQEYLKQLKPSVLDDLIAMNALYRPGPMDNIPDFIDRKWGRKPIEYLHPMLEPILGKTYGICVYQEQIMQIAQQLGGFTLAQADTLRRAMGKKQIQYMEQMKEIYFEGCSKNGIDKKTANEIWDMMVKFADYGFNKSHSAAYAYVAYQTAWLKANYMAEFMAANMTAESGDLAKVVKLIDECRKFDIKVLPPDVNESLVDFSVTDHGIRFGMAAIRNVGASAVEAILKQRDADGPFLSLFDFARRMAGNQLINKRLLESLILSGAFDSMHANRQQCWAAIDAALQYSNACAASAASGMDSLFSLGDDSPGVSIPEPRMPNVEDWPQLEKLSREKEVLNFYVSGHPLEQYELDVESFAQIKLGEVDESTDLGSPVRACGIISAIRTKLDKRENQIAFVTIEDFTGKAECIFWSDAYRKFAPMLSVGEIVFISGRAELNGADGVKIISDDVVPIAQARSRFANALAVDVQLDRVGADAAQRTYDLFKHNQGEMQCIFRIYSEERELVGRMISKRYMITPTTDLLDGLVEIYGRQYVRLIAK